MGTLSLLQLGFTLLQVTSRTGCPDQAAIASEIERLRQSPARRESRVRPGAPTAGPVGQVRVGRTADRVTVELTAPEGRPLAQRELDGTASCGALTRAVALMVVLWERELESGVVLGVPRLLTAAAPAPSPAETGGPSLASVRTLWRRWDWMVDAQAGFVASLNGEGFAAGGAVATTVGPLSGPVRGLAVRAAFQSAAIRTVSFFNAAGDWTRFTVSLGPAYRLSWWRLQVDAHLDLLLAAAFASGNTQSAATFDPGVGTGVRAGLRWGNLVPFVSVAVAGYPTGQRVVVSIADSFELPKVDALVGFGLAYQFR